MRPDNAFDKIHVRFPEPWSSKKSSWRRLLTPAMAGLLHQKLAVNGSLHLVTDHLELHSWMCDSLRRAQEEGSCDFWSVSSADQAPTPSRYQEICDDEGLAVLQSLWEKRLETPPSCVQKNRDFDFGRNRHLPFLE